VLLPQEPHAVQYLARSGARRLETLPKVGVLTLEHVKTLGRHLGGPGRGVDRLYSCLCLERAPPETGELVPQVPDELLELLERSFVRTFAV
jgi:hypothetical protein